MSACRAFTVNPNLLNQSTYAPRQQLDNQSSVRGYLFIRHGVSLLLPWSCRNPRSPSNTTESSANNVQGALEPSFHAGPFRLFRGGRRWEDKTDPKYRLLAGVVSSAGHL